MKDKENPVALRSKAAYFQALLSLMEKKPYDEISISELCKAAGLSRQTFYQHYQSKNQVLEQHIDQLCEKFVGMVRYGDINTVQELAYTFFVYFRQHTAFVKLLMENDLTGILSRRFPVHMEQLFDALGFMKKEIPLYQKKYYFSFVTGALVEMLIRWINEKQRCMISELAVLANDMVSGKLM